MNSPVQYAFRPSLSFPSVARFGLLVALLLLPILALAQIPVSDSWLGGDGSWSTNASWSAGVTPNNTSLFSYNVIVDPLNQSTVSLDQSAVVLSMAIGTHGRVNQASNLASLTVGSLSNQGELHFGAIMLGAKPLNVVNDFQNVGLTEIDFGGLVVGGNLNNSGQFLSITSPVTVGGNLTNTGSFLNDDGPLKVGGNLDNSGSLKNLFLLDISGSFNNSGRFDTGNGSGNGTSVGGALNNSGQINMHLGPLIAGSINNNGYIEGFGTIISAGNVTNSGTIAVHNGFNTTSGNLNNSGTIVTDPHTSINVNGGAFNSGSLQMAGALTAASYTQTGYWMEMFNSDTSFGAIDVTGPINLSGTIEFSFLNGYMPTLGQTFIFASFAPGELNGFFSSLLGNSFNNDLWMFDVDYDNNDGEILLTVVDKNSRQVPEPAAWALLISTLPIFRLVRRTKVV